ncbi:MAG: GNAT family N-acetyltransferase [Candidatus Omnitrophica bacterium]|nr:GNAT family N-acetyltransferase [Candidatus Omnitrophota bacterium]
MKIRKFSEGDGPKVKELILSILETEYPFDRKAYSDTDLENIVSAYGGARDTFFVIEEGDRIIATAGIKEDTKETALLRRVFVDPSRRRRGYGAQLLDETIKFCRESGYKELAFRTTSKMTQAIELCKKKGFSEKEKIDLGGFFIHKFILQLFTAH